jgi:hypothetical protein
MTEINNTEEAMKLFTVDQSLLQKIVKAIMEHTKCEKQEVFALNLAVKSFVPIINLDLGEKEFNLTSPSGFAYVESKNNSNIHFLFKQENDTFKVVALNEVKKLEVQFAKYNNNLVQLESGISADNLNLMRTFIATLRNWTNLDIQEAFLESQKKMKEVLNHLDTMEPDLSNLSNEETEKFRGLRKIHQNPVFKKFLVNTLKEEGFPISEDFVNIHSFTPLDNKATESILGYFHIVDNVGQYLVKKTEEGLKFVGINDIQEELNNITIDSPYKQSLTQLTQNYDSLESSFDIMLDDEQKSRNAYIWSKLKSSKMIAKAIVNSQESTASTAFYLAKNNKTKELRGFIQEINAVEGKIEPIKFPEFSQLVDDCAAAGHKSAIALKNLIEAKGEKSVLESKIQSFRKNDDHNTSPVLENKNKF